MLFSRLCVERAEEFERRASSQTDDDGGDDDDDDDDDEDDDAGELLTFRTNACLYISLGVSIPLGPPSKRTRSSHAKGALLSPKIPRSFWTSAARRNACAMRDARTHAGARNYSPSAEPPAPHTLRRRERPFFEKYRREGTPLKRAALSLERDTFERCLERIFHVCHSHVTRRLERARAAAKREVRERESREAREQKQADEQRRREREEARRSRAREEQTVDLDKQRLTVTNFLETLGDQPGFLPDV